MVDTTNKQLVLISQENQNLFPKSLNYCDIKAIYKNNGMVHRVFRKLVHKASLVSIEGRLFSNWSAHIQSASMVIVFDTGNAPYVVRFINKKYPKKKVILWYWNSIKDSVPIEMFDGLNVEIWSFDPEDCKKHNLKYNTQFYFKENFIDNNIREGGEDVFYIGADKDREKLLIPIKKVLDEFKISYNLNLVKYKNSTSIEIPYKSPLSYQEVIEKVGSCRCVIDLVADWQSGLTLRPLEALATKKKLITNMTNIDDYSLYNPNNIFIIGKDKYENLREFILSEYDELDWDKNCEEYSFFNWLERFKI